jgi:hypothetical protein
VFGNMEAMALNRVAAGAGHEDTRQRLARLETLKKSSALFLRYMIDAAERSAADGR